MKRSELRNLGIAEDHVNFIMKKNGEDIERTKKKFAKRTLAVSIHDEREGNGKIEVIYN